MNEHGLGSETVQFFFSRNPTVDHYYCRALLCLAVLKKHSVAAAKGRVRACCLLLLCFL